MIQIFQNTRIGLVQAIINIHDYYKFHFRKFNSSNNLVLIAAERAHSDVLEVFMNHDPNTLDSIDKRSEENVLHKVLKQELVRAAICRGDPKNEIDKIETR